MKVLWLLNLRYIGSHRKFFIKSAACIMLLVCGVFVALSLRDSYLQAESDAMYAESGRYERIVYNASPEAVKKQAEAGKEAGLGFIRMEGTVPVENMDPKAYPLLGHMDEKALYYKPLLLLKGDYPKSGNEAAVEERAYYQLGLTASPGESFTLPVIENGKTVEKTYTLSGILKDYSADLLFLDMQYADMAEYREEIHWPNILTAGYEEESVSAVNILCGDTTSDLSAYGGCQVTNYPSASAYIQEGVAVINGIFFTLTLAFLLILAVGTCNIAETDMKNRRRYLIILKCAGATPRQSLLLFALQAFSLWLVSFCAGCLLGLLMLFPAFSLAGAIRIYEVVPRFIVSGEAFFLSAGISLLSLLIPYLLKTKRVYQSRPVELMHGKNRRSFMAHKFTPDFPKLWNRAVRGSNFLKRLSFSGMVTLLAMITVYVSFLSVASARAFYKPLLKTLGKEDYILHSIGSVSTPVVFNVPFPQGSGATEEMVDSILDSGIFDVNCIASASSTVHFQKIDPAGAGRFQEYSFNSLEKEDQQRLLSYLEDGEGYAAVPLPLCAVDTATLELLRPYVTAGEIDTEKFLKGEMVVADGDIYELGETIDVISPILPEGSTESYINGEPTVLERQVTVDAVIHIPDGEKAGYSLSTLSGSVFCSYPFLSEQNPNARWDCISLSVKEGASFDKANDIMKRAFSQSVYCAMDDTAAIKAQYISSQQQWIALFLTLLGILLFISMICIFLITSAQTQNNMHSYALLRAVGISSGDIVRLEIQNNILAIFWGYVLGAALGFVLIWSGQEGWKTVETSDIYFTHVLPAAVIVFVLLILIQYISGKIIISRMCRRSVMDTIRDITN